MVQEHRITLGDYERKQLEEAITAANADQDLRMALDVVNALAMPVAVGAVAYLGYLGLTHFGSFLDPLKDTAAAKAAGDVAAAAAAGANITDDPSSLTPEQIQALANPLNPFARAAAGAGALFGAIF